MKKIWIVFSFLTIGKTLIAASSAECVSLQVPEVRQASPERELTPEERKQKASSQLKKGAEELDVRRLKEALDSGADVDHHFVGHQEGPTALFIVLNQKGIAADSGDRLECARLILSYGPNYWTKNQGNHTAFSFALSKGYTVLAEMIWDHIEGCYARASAHRKEMDLKKIIAQPYSDFRCNKTMAFNFSCTSLLKKMLVYSPELGDNALRNLSRDPAEFRSFILKYFASTHPGSCLENERFQKELFKVFEAEDQNLLEELKPFILPKIEVLIRYPATGDCLKTLLFALIHQDSVWGVRFLILKWGIQPRSDFLEFFLLNLPESTRRTNSIMIATLLELGSRSYPSEKKFRAVYRETKKIFPDLFKGLPKTLEEAQSGTIRRAFRKDKPVRVFPCHPKLRSRYFPEELPLVVAELVDDEKG